MGKLDPLFGHLLISGERVVAGAGGVTIRKNTGADVGTRPRLNLIEGGGITLTVADDAVSNEVDITVTAAGVGLGTVTSVAGGVGITNSPEPIVGAGTVDLDINSLATETATATGDLLPFVDVSVGATIAAQRKMTRANLFGTNLEAVRGLTSAADKLPYFTGAGTASVTDFTAFGRSILDDVDAAAVQVTLGLVPGTNVQAYDAELAAIAGLVSAADRLPYFTGLGTAALATFTAFGRSIIDDVDAAAVQVTLGLVPGTNVQAYDAELAAIAGLVSAADRLPYFTGLGTASLATFTAFGRSIVDDADAAAVQVTLGLVPGTNVQAYDAELAAIAGLVSAADRLPYFTGLGTAALATFSAFGRSLVDDADAAAAQTTLALVPGTNVQAYDAELAAIAGLVSAADQLPYFTGLGTAALATFTAFGRSLADDLDAAAGRTTLGLGTMAIAASADYLLLAGRTGTTNNPILSSDAGGTLSGSAVASNNLTLRSTSHATKGVINLDDQSVLWPSMGNFTAAVTETRRMLYANQTYTSVPDVGVTHTLRGLEISPTVTMSSPAFGAPNLTGIYYAPIVAAGGNCQLYGMLAAPAITNDATSLFGTFRLFQASPVLTSATATVPPYPAYVFTNGLAMTYNATGIATTPLAVGFGDQPTLKNQTTGTYNFTKYQAFRSVPSIVQTAGTMTVATMERFSAMAAVFTSGAITTDIALAIEDMAVTGVTTALSIQSLGVTTDCQHAGRAKFGATGAGDTTNGNVLELERVHALAAGINDGQAAGLVLDPGYSGVFTVARHNYIKCEDVSVSGSTVTVGAVLWFDAAIGTHKCLASNSTVATTLGSTGPVGAKTGAPAGWMRVNINGTMRHIPFW